MKARQSGSSEERISKDIKGIKMSVGKCHYLLALCEIKVFRHAKTKTPRCYSSPQFLQHKKIRVLPHPLDGMLVHD